MLAPALFLVALTSLPQEALGAVPPELAPARARAAALVERGAAPSVVVGVARHGRVWWAEAFGQADLERGIAATCSTPYPVASLTKSITGTGVAFLVAEGKIELDTPVSRYLGEGALRVHEGRAEDVTLRRVLDHEAGIPHGWETYPWSAEEASRVRSDLVHARVTFRPQRGFLYSNYAYGVAGAVLGAASGQGFAGFLDARLFRPLGMLDGGPEITADLAARAAVQYDGAGNAIAPFRFVPAGGAGAYASVNDLLRYGLFHLGGLEAEGAARPEEPLGFARARLDDDLDWIVSNGRFQGVCSNLTLVPSEGLVVAVLANTGSMLADELAASIVDDLLPGFEAKRMAFVRGFEENLALGPYVPWAELVGDWSGRLATPVRDVPFTLSFEEDGEVWSTWDDAHEGRLVELRGGPALLSASLEAALPFHPSHAGPVSLVLELVADGERLYGSAVGSLRCDEGSFALPAYVELQREK